MPTAPTNANMEDHSANMAFDLLDTPKDNHFLLKHLIANLLVLKGKQKHYLPRWNMESWTYFSMNPILTCIGPQWYVIEVQKRLPRLLLSVPRTFWRISMYVVCHTIWYHVIFSSIYVFVMYTYEWIWGRWMNMRPMDECAMLHQIFNGVKYKFLISLTKLCHHHSSLLIVLLPPYYLLLPIISLLLTIFHGLSFVACLI